MIFTIIDIEYSNDLEHWLLWYNNHKGNLEYLRFKTEDKAKQFRKRFDDATKDLKTIQEKIDFYEKQTLDQLIGRMRCKDE